MSEPSTSELSYVLFLFSYTNPLYTILGDDDALELYVHSTAFDKECFACSVEIVRGLPSDDSKADSSSASSVRSVESSPYDLYYFGIRGLRHRGPKLIFRTSKDVFPAPWGPEQDARPMQLLPVYEHHKLGKDNL